MEIIKLRKTYSPVILVLFALVALIGIIAWYKFDSIPKDLIGKFGLIVLSTPIIIIYICYKLRRVSRYPDEVIINLSEQKVFAGDVGNYKFSEIQKLILTVNQSKLSVYIRAADTIVFESSDCYITELSVENLKEISRELEFMEIDIENMPIGISK